MIKNEERTRRNEIIEDLLETLDRHSEGEKDHADRVAVYCVSIAHQLGWEGSGLLTMRYAAQLHDLGKVRIDAELLKRVGRLHEGDFLLLRMHAENAVESMEEHTFLQEAIPMVRHHHERWDGQGYPDQLSGDSIPLGARIISVAEAFDVMTFPPFWSEPKTEVEAISELERCKGSHFDPAVVDAFVAVQPLVQPLGL